MEAILTFEQMWRELAPIGQGPSGGYFRQSFHAAERELHGWFVAQATARGLDVEVDRWGNTVAWWRPAGRRGEGPAQAPGAPAEQRGGVLTGSHLDSVVDGGGYDGPLGVVSALAAIDLLRERGAVPARPIGVAVFVEEEGSRFGVPCLGSRLATGALAWADARRLTDRDGVALPEALAGAGLEPESGPQWLPGVGCFVELHIEQGRALVELGAPVAVAGGIWPHGRWRFDFTGTGDHAGTTRMEQRHDPMLTYAMTVLAANKQARLGGHRATFGRVEVAPNATNAIASRVTAWLDARCPDETALAELVAAVSRQAGDRAERDGTAVTVTAESVSAAVTFDPDLAARIGAGHESGPLPVLATAAGHDAGVLSAAGIATGMLFVRNPTGVSHAPAEHASIADCLVGVSVLADVLERLAR